MQRRSKCGKTSGEVGVSGVSGRSTRLSRTYVRRSRYNVYVESSLDHSLELAESAALSVASSLQNASVLTAANVAVARALVDRFDKICTHIIATFSESPTIREDGYRNVSEWLAFTTHARPAEGEQRVAHSQVYAKLRGGPTLLMRARSVCHMWVSSQRCPRKRVCRF